MNKVSIIIPTFNRIEVLNRAVQSVFSQSYKNWELIVVDDGSTDGTYEYLLQLKQTSSYGEQIHIYKTENSGVSAARNYGVTKSNYDWISFLDSDDEWLSNKLELQVPLTDNFKLIHGEEIWIRNGVRVNSMNKHKKSGGRIFSQCVPLCCISPSTVLLEKNLYSEMGGFREDYPVCEDYDLWLKICESLDVGFIEEPIINKYGGHDDQLSRKYFAMDYWRVKALEPFLKSEVLSKDELSLVKCTILKKSEILLKGYEKHKNYENRDEINVVLSLIR